MGGTVKVQVAATARPGSPVRRRQEMPGIIVGIDGSHHSTRALEWALKEAALQHAQLTVLTVHSVPASPWTGNPVVGERDADDQEMMLKAAEELTHKAASKLGEARPDSVMIRAISGYPARELVDESRDADLVVVGSRGAGGFAKLMMGSISSQVVEHAHCPVVVVPSDR
jgi:nucleotide-binding universal stress UspA family protein